MVALLKNEKVWISGFFVGDVIIGRGFNPVYQILGANAKEPILLFKFLAETRL